MKKPKAVELPGKVVKICQRFHTHSCFLPVTGWIETRVVKDNIEYITQRATCANGHPNLIEFENRLEYL
jgi:hypothetical protein